MPKLTVVKQGNKLVIDSREVAEMVGKRHSDLLESIKGYIQHLTNGKFRSSDFFIESSYKDAKGEVRPCYLLTRKGCDMVANKMTGKKGVLFTAAYVTKFEEMERILKGNNKQSDDLLKQQRIEAMLNNSRTRQAKLLTDMAKEFKENISDVAIQSLISHAAQVLTGKVIIPLPEIEKHYTTGEIAEELETTPQMLGRIANQNELKTEENGKWVLDKSPHSSKQVQTFLYNERGRQKLISAYQNRIKEVK